METIYVDYINMKTDTHNRFSLQRGILIRFWS